MKKIIYFVLGQTASGKTDFATKLAQENGGELINCDSRQIYKELNIITGKTDNPKGTCCVDMVDPDKPFSAYEYACHAYDITKKIIENKKVPIVVGGTGMYAYLLKYFDPKKEYKSPSDLKYFDKSTLEDLQKKIQSEYNFIWEKLNESDRKNKRRLCTALHRIIHNTSLPIEIKSENNLANLYKIKEYIFLHKDKESMEAKLKRRIKSRMQMGAVEECKKLLSMGFKYYDPGLMSIGYQSVFRFLDGEISETMMLEEWFVKERQYAKRQKTYLLKYFPSAEIRYVQ